MSAHFELYSFNGATASSNRAPRARPPPTQRDRKKTARPQPKASASHGARGTSVSVPLRSSLVDPIGGRPVCFVSTAASVSLHGNCNRLADPTSHSGPEAIHFSLPSDTPRPSPWNDSDRPLRTTFRDDVVRYGCLLRATTRSQERERDHAAAAIQQRSPAICTEGKRGKPRCVAPNVSGRPRSSQKVRLGQAGIRSEPINPSRCEEVALHLLPSHY